ncbi:MAG TPA: c-type cytochrome [Gemmatimonadales bacterium]|nr:c-type cytochrome [Gemmatimonadales bacterium]
MARLLLRSLAASSFSLALPALLAAQGFPGPPPKNLQVLPKDLSRNEVVARMRVIAMSLGVSCEHCHVSTTGPDGREQNDFAADDKDTKKTARAMMRMVNDINDQYLITTMGRTLSERHRVSCETCHHGLAKPRTIQAELLDAIDAKGADSAVALYRDLRSRYLNRGSYDFSELALADFGRLTTQRPAVFALLKLNLEFYPQSVPTFTALAQQSLQAGDTAAALDALSKASAIAPDNPQVKNLLARLKGIRPNPLH